MSGNKLIGNLRNIPGLQPEGTQRKADVSSSSSSLGGGMEPLKSCPTTLKGLKAGQAVTALTQVGDQFFLNTPRLSERPQ